MRRGEEGLTLAELVVATTILALIIGVLGNSIIAGFRTTDATQQRLSESHDAQMASSFLSTDVQSAEVVSLSDATCTTPDTPFIDFKWTADGVVTHSGYFVRNVGSERQLVRRHCGAATTEVVIAHHLAPGSPAPPDCPPDPVCPAQPRKVVIALTDAGGYEYTLSGIRRTS